MPPNWHHIHAERRAAPAVVDPRRRLRICLGVFLAGLAAVFARAVHIELTQGDTFRREARRPLRRERSLPGLRGRILARDGTVLAHDRRVPALAVHYRWLENPPDAAWLQQTARRRLAPGHRRDPQRVADEQVRLLAERDELARQLAVMCGLAPEEWTRRATRIQARVERIAQSVNRRRREAAATPCRPEPTTAKGHFGRWLLEMLDDSPTTPSFEPITVAEQIDHHVMVEDVPLQVVAQVEGQPERYPGVRIVEQVRRVYPSGTLAAHLLGYLGHVAPEELASENATGTFCAKHPEGRSGKRYPSPFPAYHAEDLVGRAGIERQYEPLLRAGRGLAVDLTDHLGRTLSHFRQREPGVGRDLVLTIEPRLQRDAETLLDAALARREVQGLKPPEAGGAIVVMDVRDGSLLAAASAPRFDPGVFLLGASRDRAALLRDPARPLLDRCRQMVIAPGSVMKTVTAVALLDSGTVDPREPFYCQGYLHDPDRQRCAVFVRHGVGHGQVTLIDALAQSCNVYFFHHAARMGPEPLVDWAARFGLGMPSGVDLPGESTGTLPMPANIAELEGHAWRPGDTQALAVGQGSLTATPLEIARMMAAVANGGRLVTPHVASRLGLPETAEQAGAPADDNPADLPAPRPIPGLDSADIETVRRGLERVVADARGTAHATVFTDSVAIAGKTGTAETGGDRASHAWFAGYVPADKPRYAIVVALQHAGDAAQAAGPVVQRLVRSMQRSGLVESTSRVATRSSPAP